MGGTPLCAAQQLKTWRDQEDLCGEGWELNDDEITALDQQGTGSPMGVEDSAAHMKAEEMAKEYLYLVRSILQHNYHQAWQFLTVGDQFGADQGTLEPPLHLCYLRVV